MQMPSSDTRWIIGIMLAALAALSVQIDREVAGLRAEMTAQISAVRAELDGLRGEMRASIAALQTALAEMRTDLRGFDARLRAVETETAKVVQRLAILERIMLPTPEPEPDAGQ